MYSLSSHILDTTLGRPVADLAITLTGPDGKSVTTSTDADGRCNTWDAIDFAAGTYHLRFHTGTYLEAQHGSAFYPFVDVHFVITPEQGHYHIPLLLSPYGFSSYRGS